MPVRETYPAMIKSNIIELYSYSVFAVKTSAKGARLRRGGGAWTPELQALNPLLTVLDLFEIKGQN